MALITVSQAAEELGQSKAFVRSLCHDRLVDYRVVRGRYYMLSDSLREWLAGTTPVSHSTSTAVMPRGLRRGRHRSV